MNSFEFRIYPTKAQEKLLSEQFSICAELYNILLQQRKTEYEQNRKSISLFQQHKFITQLKEQDLKYDSVHSQVLQNLAVRLDLAFKAFFRRVKAGENPGFPRFKSKERYNSITFPQVPSGCQIKGNHLILSKIGKVKIKQHRQLEGKPKTCTIKKSSTGKWYAGFSCEIEKSSIKSLKTKEIGIDVGLESFAHFSNNEKIENPRFFRQEEKSLAKVQRKLSKQAKGSKERKKAKKIVARIHERIKFKRKNFAHQESRKIVDKYSHIFIEDLNINKMQHDNFRCMNKSISDAAWNMFFNFLSYKAEDAGKILIKVNPAYTSQTCSNCNHRNKLKLSDRVFQCECCNFQASRDLNAALNIKTLGTQSLAKA